MISTRSIRWSATKVPLVLPTSTRTQRLPSTRSSAWRQDTRSSVIGMSPFGSRPIRYAGPGVRTRSIPS
jgi:hypothetical protein